MVLPVPDLSPAFRQLAESPLEVVGQPVGAPALVLELRSGMSELMSRRALAKADH